MADEGGTQQATNPISLRPQGPTFEEGSWPNPSDLLNRREEIENLTPVLLNAESPLVFALDAPWGGGKTTFIKLWQQYLNKEGYISLYLNAWESDFSDDPLLPMVCTIDKWLDQQSDESSAKKSWNKAMQCAPGIVKSTAVAAAKAATFGALDLEKEYEKLVSELAGNAAAGLMESFKVKQASLEKFKTQLSGGLDALPDNQPNLVIFVDELDRCKPTYAIELLERIKHLFDIDRIVFVLAFNRDQLAKSLQGVYGPSFDGDHYLKRFIDLDYKLSIPDLKTYISAKFNQSDLTVRANRDKHTSDAFSWVKETFYWLASRFNYQLRDVDQLITRFRLILRSVPDSSLHPQILVAMLFLRENNPELFQEVQQQPQKINEATVFLLGKPLEESGFPKTFIVVAGLMVGELIPEDDRSAALKFWCEARDKFEQNTQDFRELERLRSIAAQKDNWNAKDLMRLISARIELIEKINIQ